MKNLIQVLGLLVLLFSTTAWADPLNVELNEPVPNPAYLGFPSTLAIHVEPTYNPSSVTGLSATISPLGALRGFTLESHTCPGVMTAATGPGGAEIIEWTGMGNLSNAQEINCEVTLFPTRLSTNVILQFDCNGCESDPLSNRSTVSLLAEEPMDLGAYLVDINAYPDLGQQSLTVRFGNYGTGVARNVVMSLYGAPEIFASIVGITGDDDCNDTEQDFESVNWQLTQLDPGQIEECTFTYNVPSTNQFDINLLINGESWSGQGDPFPDNNSDMVTLRPSEIVVDSRFSFYPDANPGDGICADSNNGACSLRAAVDETNALPGFQTILIPYEFGGYYLGGLTGYLTITDPVRMVGLPDPVSGDYPWITRSDGEDTGLIRVDTGSTTETELLNLDLRGQDKLVSVDGAVVIQASGALRVTESIISGGRTTGSGGGLRGSLGLVLAGVEFRFNQAGFGGAVAIYSLVDNVPDAQILGSSFHDNHAIDNDFSSLGGAVYFFNAKVEVERSSFVNNSADKGGGLYTTGNSDVHVINSTISNNIAYEQGGGIYDNGGTSLEYVTLVYNEAGPDDLTVGEGGGVYVDHPTGTDIAASIIAYNQAQSTGGTFGFPKGANCFGVMDGGNNSLNGITTDPDCDVVGSNNALTAAPAFSEMEMTAGGVAFYRLTRVNQEIDQVSGLCQDENGVGLTADIISRSFARPTDGDGDGEARCDRGAVENGPAALIIDVTESGPADWRISLDEPWGECITLECSFYFIPVGTTIELTAEPSAGTQFNGWGGACAAAGTNPVCSVNVTLWSEVTASFSSSATPRTLTVEVVGSGTVTSNPVGINCPNKCSKDFANGTSVLLTATPSDGYVFDRWGGACAGLRICLINMNAAKTVQAIFEATSDLIFKDGFDIVGSE